MINERPACFGLTFLGYNEKILDNIVLDKEFSHITTVNAEFIVTVHEERESQFAQIVKNSICTVDGQIPLWIAKYFGKNTFELEKISGSDYSRRIIELSKQFKLKVFFLGGNSSSIENLLNIYGNNALFGGYSPEFENYPFSEKNSLSIKDRLTEFEPDIVLVGFGAVKQELWIDDNKKFLVDLGVSTAIGVGGTFEFLAGTIPRAPVIIQKMGLESIYRLVQQPSIFRFKRILKSFKIFLYMSWKR